jgi:hypothetical protein
VRSAPYAYHLGMIERELGQDAPARRHLEEALRINPYFSPSGVPAAREALAVLGDVPDTGLPVTDSKAVTPSVTGPSGLSGG